MKEGEVTTSGKKKNYKRKLLTVICQQIGPPRRNRQGSRNIEPAKTE